MSDNFYIFQGDNKQKEIKAFPSVPPWRQFQSKNTQTKGEKYLVDDEEKEIVNAALHLRRPLFVTGQPGVGKSSLAYAVSYELGLGDVLLWPITSKSTLQQGLYSYDAIARLQYASLPESYRSDYVVEDIGRYIRLGPLGTAFLPSERPRVLLIDEIDKSDIDFPNDLLNIFEEGQFEIPELSRLSGQLGSSLFKVADFKESAKLIGRLKNATQSGTDTVSFHLRSNLSSEWWQKIGNYSGGNSLSKDILDTLVSEFNRLLAMPLYQRDIFAGVKLSKETQRLLSYKDPQNFKGKELQTLNRLLLEDAYPDEIEKSQKVQNVDVFPYDSQTRVTITNGHVCCQEFPFVVMTSNGERDFPPAFLRRCLQLTIQAPSQEKLEKIVRSHLGDISQQETEVKNLIERFVNIRDKEAKNIATDQLLNAVYLVMKGVGITDKNKLLEAILKPLSEGNL